jgi:hypothetical protein
MGGLANIIADSSYNGPNVGYSLPVSRGARTVLFPKVDGPTSIANKVDVLAGGVGTASVAGTPGYGAGYVTFDGLISYQSTMSADASTSTMLFVARNIDTLAANATTPGVGGNLSKDVSGYGCFFTNISGHVFVAQRVTNIGGTPTASSLGARVAISDNSWAFLAAVFDDSTKTITVYNKTTSVTSTPITYTGSVIAGGGNVRVGSNMTLYGGNCDIAFVAEHNVALTVAEIDTIYLAIKARLAAYVTPIAI